MRKTLFRQSLVLVLIVALFSISAYAQDPVSSVSGVVQNEKGEPFSGASIVVKNTKTNFTAGTQTDSSGVFTFSKLPAGGPYSFQISAIGYESQTLAGYTIKPNATTLLTLKLNPQANNINEVVIVGYGTEKKVNLTGAISQVDGKIFTDKPVANVAQSLQGVIPNLNITFSDGHPGSTGTFNIRGMASLNDNTGSPLVLVDGVPGDINKINPTDVESISVLKDAASAAIYGGRAAFGVILVTTKQGKSGKMQVTYNANYGIQQQTSRTDYVTDGFLMDSLVDVSFSRHGGSSYTGFNDQDYAQLKARQTDKTLPSVVTQNRNGTNQFVYYGSTDWYHWLYSNSQPSMSHNLSLTGGTDKVRFLISGRYFDQKGMYQKDLHTDVYHGYNFRAKIDAKLTPFLSVYSNTQFAANDYTWPGWGYNSNIFNFAVHALASYVPQNPDGTYTYITNLNNYQIGNGIFADLQNGKSKGGNNNYDLSNTIGFNINVIRGLVITGNYTYDIQPYNDYQRRTMIPYSIFPGVLSYTGSDYLTRNTHLDQHHTVNLFGTYQQDFSQHHFKLVAGYNQELQKYSLTTGTRYNLLSQDLNQLDLGTGQQQTGGNANEWALLGFFGRVNYDFANRYLLELDGRYDGTSRFPAGSRFGFFPSVSGGWRISEEDFFSSIRSTVSQLKLRASYGSLGNQNVGSGSANYYPYIPVMGNSLTNWINNGNQTQALSSPAPVTPNFTWEKAATIDFGADINFFKNRLQLTYDWYTRRTTNMLINGTTLPGVFGASSPKQNAGDLRTNGFDFSAMWSDHFPLAGKPFSYSIGVALSDYTAKITRFDNPTYLLSNHYVGEQIGTIWGYTVDGYFKTDEEAQGYAINQSYVNSQIKASPGVWNKLHAGDMKFVDISKDGVINNGQNTLANHGDVKKIGNTLPRYSFGINGRFSWNNIDLAIALQGIGKQNWYPPSEANKFWGPYGRPYSSFIPKTMLGQMWTPQNPNAYFPLLRGYEAYSGGGELNSVNNKYLQNLAYLRVKNITVGYSVPNSIVSRMKMQNVRVYFSGQNLFTFTKLKNDYLDPEQVASGSQDTNGNDYPFFKNFAFGLDVTF
ncbi:MAG: TonB-dependent receptor [Bacteroidetes bacterium]|nr:TonB-dependent receptor [Bacteroidota bacterium]